jgi:hypothetical protein
VESSVDKNNPGDRRAEHFTARVGKYLNLSAYLYGYERAVELLYGSVARNNEPQDLIAKPLLFLMRHSLELGYKFTLDEICKLDGKRYNPKEDGHSLTRMHKKIRPLFESACKSHGINGSGFDEHYENTRIAMEIFERLDKASVSFRYPELGPGQSVFEEGETVNLLQLKNCYDEAMILLRHTADVIECPW